MYSPKAYLWYCKYLWNYNTDQHLLGLQCSKAVYKYNEICAERQQYSYKNYSNYIHSKQVKQ